MVLDALTGLQIQSPKRSIKGGPRIPDLCEVHEMLEAGVEVRLSAQAANLLEVRVVDVCVHSEEPFEYGPHHIHEVSRKMGAVLLREDRQVVHLQKKGRPRT